MSLNILWLVGVLALCALTYIRAKRLYAGSFPFKAKRYTRDQIVTLESQANDGNLSAQLQLGLIHRDGLGVPESNDNAIKWFNMAAELGSKQAAKEAEKLQKIE